MKKFALILIAATALTACHGKSESQSQTVVADGRTVHIKKSQDINGAKTATDLVLSDFALRARLGNNPITAGYVTIKNDGKTEDRLVSAACACAAKATLHTMVMKGGQMEMAEAPNGFVIAPGQSVVFAPGGNHIMFDGVNTGLNDGDTQTITLHFEKAGDISIDMPVTSNPLPGKHDAMAGMKM